MRGTNASLASIAWELLVKSARSATVATAHSRQAWVIVALATLAIALNASMFALMYGLLVKQLPFPVDDRLVTLQLRSDTLGLDLGWSVPFLETAGSPGQSLQRMAAFKTSEPTLYSDAARMIGSVSAVTVSPDIFPLLGIHPVAGRLLNADDTRIGAPCRAVVSADFHAQIFGRAFAEGELLNVSGAPCLIVGVVPEGSGFPDAKRHLWLPMKISEQDRSAEAAGSFGDLKAIARLAPGQSSDDATQEMRRRLAADRRLDWIVEQVAATPSARPLRFLWVGDRVFTLTLMSLAALMVFAVTTANLCNLFALSVIRRQHTFALMEALGARRARNLALITCEALSLAMLGALGALALLAPGMRFLQRAGMLPANVPQHVGLDLPTVAAMAVMVAVIAAAMTIAAAGLLRQNLAQSLRQGGNGQTGSARGARLRRHLVAAQIACTLVLVFGTGLLIRSSDNLIAEDIGFARGPVSVGQLGADRRSIDVNVRPLRQALAAWLDEVGNAPGIREVALASTAPFGDNVSLATMHIKDGDGGPREINAYEVFVSQNYFRALGLPLLQGRGFRAHETRGGAPTIIVDATFASRYLGDGDPLGRLVSVSGPYGLRDHRVVGVVGVARQRSLRSRDEYATVYRPMETPWPLPDMPADSVSVIVNTSLPLSAVRPMLEHPLRRSAAGLRFHEIRTMQAIVQETLGDALRLNMMLKLLVSVAMVLSAVGLYALLAFSVASRTREFGVRLALGGDRRHLLALVGAEGARLYATATLVALPAALLVGRSLSDKLFGIDPFDPLLMLIVLMLFGLVCAVANLVPALQASRVSPMEALRAE
ncbi:ABC transporter permease [Xanthomonas cannabis]|nr:ABC transporter permease [Xanthomonas cannabis]MCC8442839.1 ABC transporter permease [Xanthomonas cannabis]